MPRQYRGFTLVELLVTVTLIGIIAVIAVPNFSATIQKSKADTEISDLQRAFNYARLEAITRGVNTSIQPSIANAAWTTALNVVLTSDGTVLRVIPAMNTGATLDIPSSVTSISFNNLGGLTTPSSSLTITYSRGTNTRTLAICLNGRIVLNGVCNAT
ncbi:type IV fimbrial biogenesis protein FimU [Pseudomonas sp. NFACC02]|uniref:GspH/FimT family pseudopilin n=1 Tax=Pseudomonas sp. NFACC02 TaxID=1566250 RepID=UPI0008C39362|nr:GspH/FimT family pseudopilin [Pseudomonas sp. NFACC02]SEQ83821.1 type IV fimbrial biogenesis protein FimU [Pseudomonas sp. NFACC02]